jgi:hypothetical protein
MRPRKAVEKTIRTKLHYRVEPPLRDRLLARAMAQQEKSHDTEPALRGPVIGRSIMTRPLAKLTIAAAIIVAVVLGLFEFLGSDATSGVVWAEVAQRLEASTGMTARMRNSTIQPGLNVPADFEAKIYISPLYGYRMDSFQGGKPGITSVCNNARRKLLMVTHFRKQYSLQHVPDEAWAEVAEAQSGAMDPTSIVTLLLSGDYTEIGRRTIDGVKAEGLEIQDPTGCKVNVPADSHVLQLWVNVETGYPVSMQSEVVANDGAVRSTQILDRFEWNVELDPSLFELDIPDGYTETEAPQLW